MAKKGVYFTNKQTRIREFYAVQDLHGKTFEDVAHELYEVLLLEGKTIKNVMKERGNLINTEERAGLIKFFYLDDGLETPITKAQIVLEMYFDTGVNEVLFFVDVIGGCAVARQPVPLEIEATSHLTFINHAKGLLEDPRTHGRWDLVEYEPNKFRLMKTVKDKYRRKLNLIIQPNAGYPLRPPLVMTIPRHRDPCFNSEGKLDWTIVRNNGQYTWELYAKHRNPLTYLFGELNMKYKLVF